MSIVSFSGNIEATRRRYWYAGTSKLLAGTALCFKHDAAVTNDIDKEMRGQNVATPVTANLNFFAGVLERDMQDAGPGWVDVIPPTAGLILEQVPVAGASVANAASVGIKDAVLTLTGDTPTVQVGNLLGAANPNGAKTLVYIR